MFYQILPTPRQRGNNSAAANESYVKAVRTNNLSMVMKQKFNPNHCIYELGPIEDKGTSILETSNVSLMHIAAFFGSIDVFIYLYERGTPKGDIHVRTPRKEDDPLTYAFYSKSLDVAAYILSIDPSAWKTKNGRANIRLLEAITTRRRTSNSGDSKGNKSTNPFSSKPLLQLLSSFGFPYNYLRPEDIMIPIKSALDSCDLETLNFFTDHSKVSIHDSQQRSLLMIAINARFCAAIQPLIDHGIDPLEVLGNQTALSWACMLGDVDIVRVLCQQYKFGKEVDIPLTCPGPTAIHCAISSQNPEIVKLVLETKPNIYRVDSTVNTKPTIITDDLLAIEKNKDFSTILELLIKEDFDINVRASNGCTLLNNIVRNWPITKGPDSTSGKVEIMLKLGADPNTADLEKKQSSASCSQISGSQITGMTSMCILRDQKKLPKDIMKLLDSYPTIQPPVEHTVINVD